MERVTWKFTLPCVKYMANRNLLYASGNSNTVRKLYVYLEGWDGEKDGRGVQERGDIYIYIYIYIYIPMADSC